MATSSSRPNRSSQWRPVDRSSSTSSCPPGLRGHKPSSVSAVAGDGSSTDALRHQTGKESGDGAVLPHGSLVPYLPQDDAVAAGLGAHEGAIDANLTQQVADLLNEELGKLLLMKHQEFWKSVTTDTTVQLALDSYLQFRGRWFDLHLMKGVRTVAGIIIGDLELSRRVFMVLYRLSSNQDSGSLASDCISAKEHADVIRDKRLLDVTKLLDICAIYGHTNAELTSCLVNNAFRSQPLYNDDLADVIPPLLDTIDVLHQRLSLAVPDICSVSNAVMTRKELLEVITFLMDGVTTLDAFIETYPIGAYIFITSRKNRFPEGQLLFTLASVHDTMLPMLFEKIFKLDKFSGNMTDIKCRNDLQRCDKNFSDEQIQLKLLRKQLLKFVWHLLSICYLDESPQVYGGNKGKSIHIGFREEEAKTRGNALVHVILGMASRYDGLDGYQPSATLIRKIERRYKLMQAVSKSQTNGVIILDDAQIKHMSAVVLGETDSSYDNGNSLGQEEAIISESKISHIKDLFPTYGSGFLAICLQVYDDNPEEVIQRILDDTLHPDLLSLDRTLETKPGSTAALHNKGKEKLSDVPSTLTGETVGSLHSSKEMKKPVSESISPGVDGVIQSLASSSSASSSHKGPDEIVRNHEKIPLGKYIRKGKEITAAQLLDKRDEASILHSLAMATQYEDEYDDSFDDLNTHIGHGGNEEMENLADVMSGSRISVANELDHNGASVGRSARSVCGINEPRIQPHWERNPVNKNLNNTNTTGFEGTNRNSNRGSWKDASKTQYYVKDGKNYSYKIAGAVSVSSIEEAEAVKAREHDTIYGLGRGGNVPFKAPGYTIDNDFAEREMIQGGRGFSQSHIRGKIEQHGRGRGRVMKDYDKHHKKDRAMRKHFTSIGGI